MLTRNLLHPYQNRGVEFIKDTPHCMLWWEMGCGKSLAVLTAVSDLIDTMDITSVLIVAPKKVAETTWTDEAEKWQHLSHLRLSKVMGTEKRRIEALDTRADIYVIGRDSFVWLVKHYNAKLPFDMIVLDELTSFKSTTSQRFKAFRLIRSQPSRIVGLTGTPAPNGYEDLFGQVFCIDGGQRLGKYITHFRDRYMNIVMARGQHFPIRKELKLGAKEAIDDKLSDITIAMKAEDYLSLPDKRVINHSIVLPDKVMKQYKQFQRDLVLPLKDTTVTAQNAATLAGKLMQFANGFVYAEGGVNGEYIHSEKLEMLKEILEAAGSSVLVFYNFIEDRRRIMEAIPDARVYDTVKDLHDWNEGRIQVLLAHPASCAYGLNLQRGGHIVVWYGPTWNLEQYEQANARLYRQGQKHSVQIHHMLAKGTIDEKITRVLTGKAVSQDALMEAMKEIIYE